MTSVRLLAAAAVLAVTLAVPTVAISLADDTGGSVQFEPSSPHATIEDGELTLDFEALTERATTTFDDVFSVAVTDDEVHSIWLSHEVEGLTFYADGDRTQELNESNRLELDAGESATVGLSIDTREAVTGTGTFTVHVEYAEDDPDDPGTPGPGPGPGPGEPADPDPDDPDDEPVEETDGDLNVTNATLERTEVTSGEAFAVTGIVEVDGDGEEAVRGPVALEIDGWLVDSQSVAVDPGETVQVVFEWRIDEPGSYDVSVGSEPAGTLTVTEPDDVRSAAVRQLSSPLTAAMAPPAGLGLLFVIGTAAGRVRS